MPPFLFWTTVFLVGAYLVSTDPRYAQLIDITSQQFLLEIKRRYLMLIMHPRNPITNWIMERKMRKLARELAKELNLPEED